MYKSQSDYRNALSLYQEALTLSKETRGQQHPSYSMVLNNLGLLHHSLENDAEAVPLIQQALALTKKMFGEKHPRYLLTLNNLAGLYRAQGAHHKALPLYQEAVSLTKEVLGEKHPQYVSTINNLAFLYYDLKKYHETEALFLQGANAFLRTRSRVSQAGFQRASYTSGHSPISLCAGVLATNGKPTEAWHWLEQSLGRATFDEVVARKNRTQQEQQRLDQLHGSIEQTETLLKKLASQPKRSQDQQQLQKDLLSKQSEHFSQLAKLHKQLEEKYGITEGQSYALKQIQSALSNDSAYLTWIDSQKEHWVVLVRASGEPICQQLTANKTDWTKADSDLPVQFYELLKTNREANAQQRGTLLQKLQKQRIAPIAKHLKNIQHVIVLPSPLMDKIPIELLLPKKKVSHAPSATMYAYLKQLNRPKSNLVLALGDPIFNPQEESKERPLPDGGILITSVVTGSIADQAKLTANHVLLAYDGTSVNSIDEILQAMTNAKGKKEVRIKVWDKGNTFEKSIPTGKLGVLLSKEPAALALKNRRKQNWQLVSRGDVWNALPGTRVEVASIAELVDNDHRHVLLDEDASEQRLHQLATTDKLKEYKYLHFATHGQVNRFLPMESALILSRNNLQADVSTLKANAPYFDGRLTAKEVALHWQLDADLITLSACNSGLGKHAKGEGYMGFAQSFLIRGSRSVVLSLWSVDDTATALLMKRFYENLLKKKMSKLDALRDAKKWLRTLPRSEVMKHTAAMTNDVARGPGRKKLPPLSKVPMSDREEDAPYAHPYYWSAFILIGSPD